MCTVWDTKVRKHFNAIMEVFYCETVSIGLPGDASDYNEDHRRTGSHFTGGGGKNLP